ncbi:MAG: tetratricopeptide repeat protein [Chloroflexi bacterium]|nr:tetratricopeptide repeat protein [Chloroflexota bacterium]
MMFSLLLSVFDVFVIDTDSLGDGRFPFVAPAVSENVSASDFAQLGQLPAFCVIICPETRWKLAQLRLCFLGAAQISLDGQAAGTDRRKAVALLAYLAVTAVPHNREALAARFWPEADQSRALAYLRRTLWEINQMIGEGRLLVERDQVAFLPQPDAWVDVAVFQSGCAAGDEAGLATAVALYQGDFMAGFTLRDAPDFDAWQYDQAERLRRQFGDALQRLAQGAGEKGAWETAVSHARRWLSLDLLNEAAHRLLMRLYAQMGQRAEAIRQYDFCLQTLANELGIAPEPETTALLAQIKAGQWAATPDQPPSGVRIALVDGETAVPPKPSRSYLPAQLTPFVGRQDELAEINRLFADPACRLLTLVGPGGSGKTRLALQLARRYVNGERAVFPDGVYFVPLAPLTAPDFILAALTSALRLNFFAESESPRQQLLDILRHQSLLLVLDNFEHLLSGEGVHLPADILTAAPDVKILATSRLRLNVRGEQVYQVVGMKTPPPELAAQANAADYSAVKLFVQSAQRIAPDFALTRENQTAIIRICQLVNGLPLGIELAAGWLALLTPDEIVTEMASSLDFLETTQHDVPERQRSLRAVFDYSWRLLTPPEQQIFAACSVFYGSFSRQAAQAVTGASLRDLMGLVTKSLLWREENGRFQIHELLRQYAHERLTAVPATLQAVSDRHSAYFNQFLREQGEAMKGPNQKETFDLVELEEDNIRAAWLWALAQEDYACVNASLDGLLIFYSARALLSDFHALLGVGVERLETAVAGGNDTPETRRTLFYLLVLSCWSLNYELTNQKPRALCQRALALLPQIEESVQATLPYAYLGIISAWLLDMDAGLAMFTRCLARLRQKGDVWETAVALNIYGGSLIDLTRWDEARQYLGESINLSRQIGNRLLLAQNLQTMGYLEAIRRNYDEAFRLLEECQGIYQALNVPRGAASVLYNMGDTSISAGQYRQSIQQYQASVELFETVGEQKMVASMYSWQSIAAARLGDFDLAAVLRRKSLDGFAKIKDEGGLAWAHWEWGELQRIQGDLPAAREAYEKAHAIFQAQHMAAGLAFYHRGLGELAFGRQDWAAAQSQYEKSLTFLTGAHNPWIKAYVLCQLARVWVRRGDLTQARGLLGQAMEQAMMQGDKGLTLFVLAGMVELRYAEGLCPEAIALAAYVRSHLATFWEAREWIKAWLEEKSLELPPEELALALNAMLDLSLDTVVISARTALGADSLLGQV